MNGIRTNDLEDVDDKLNCVPFEEWNIENGHLSFNRGDYVEDETEEDGAESEGPEQYCCQDTAGANYEEQQVFDEF